MSTTSVVFSLFCGFAGQVVPNVSAGPDLEAEAKVVEAPIANVTVFSDRARVRRSAEVALPAGITALRLPDLPGATLLDTVRVSAAGARLIRVEAAPIQREQISISAVEGALDELEKKTDRRDAIDGQLTVYTQELSFLAELMPKPPAEEKDRANKPLPAIAFDGWRAVLDFLGERMNTVRARIRALGEERRDVEENIAALRRHVALRDLGAFTAQTMRVLAIVDAKAAGKASLSVEYFVPGASWLPAYELHYYAKDAAVQIATYGLVTQATGEDWNDVQLMLSTAIPGQGIEMPELLTWTLGEKSEFIPRPWPVAAAAVPPAFPPPSPSITERERELRAKISSLQSRLQKLDEVVAQRPAEKKAEEKSKKTYSFEDDTIEGDLVRPDSDAVATRRRPQSRPQPSMPRTESPPPAPMDFAGDIDVAESAPSSAGSAVGRAFSSILGTASSGESYANTPLALFEQDRSRVPAFADVNLPAMIAGGLDYVYPAASRFTVPSQANRLRVPLSVEKYPVSVYYEATPSLAKTAFLRAAVENKGDRPLLRGPVSIFVGDAFTGEGLLQTTGPGGKIELPLGADEDIRLVRNVKPATKTEGVFSKHDITTYTTEIEVGNYKSRPIRILVLDQIPKSQHEDIEIKLVSTNPAPKDPPNADGLMRFDVTLKPGETKKIVFAYSVERPTNWQLQQY